MIQKKSLAVIIPTLNAAADWPGLTEALAKQGVDPGRVLIVDSASSDGTAALAREHRFVVKEIARASFTHGGTRWWAAQFFPDAEVLLYLSQDAVPADAHALEELVEAFENPEIGAAFGRQLPRTGATAIEAHARTFNYPAETSVRTLASKARLGLKTVFLSNAFAAYRRAALEEIAGFPSSTIFGEDTIAAARLLLAGWSIAYRAEARVYHSHSYSWRQEFERYFDIGVLHAREAWLLEEFGAANGEGRRFVSSELRYLMKQDRALILDALARTALKLAGYRMGRMEAWLGGGAKRHLSMHKLYWAK